MLRAWRTRDFRAVFHLACRLGLTPEIIAADTGLPADLVVSVMKGNATLNSAGLVASVADGLSMPDEARNSAGLAPRPAHFVRATGPAAPMATGTPGNRVAMREDRNRVRARDDSEKAGQRRLREQMRGMGMSRAEIAAEIARRYQFRPRKAWRIAWGWTLEEAAERFNAVRAKDTSEHVTSLTGSRLSEWESWPLGGRQPRKPTIANLCLLAEIYQAGVLDLIDYHDRAKLPAGELIALEKMGSHPADGEPSGSISSPENRVSVGTRIAALRRERGLTQESLAERAGVSAEVVRKLEQETRHSARLATFDSLAHALDVSTAELIDTSSPRQPGRKRGRLPDHLPDEVIKRPDFVAACNRLDLGEVFRIAVSEGFTVSHIARRCEMSVSQVTDYIRRGRPAKDIKVFQRAFDGLGIPLEKLRMTTYTSARQGNEPDSLRKSSLHMTDPEMLADQISELVTLTEATNVGEGTLSYLDEATIRLANDCLTVSPILSHERAGALAKRVFDILQTGRQRVRQTRDLYVTAGKLCAVLSWVSSDLGQLVAAEAYARNGWTLAEEADHNGLRALLLCARSKNAFWSKSYDDAAQYARHGYEYNPPGTARVLLACQEADALQAAGRIDDARNALYQAERTQDGIHGTDELGGIFACGAARQANYSIATYLSAGAVGPALEQVQRAEEAWRDGEQWAYGTWAQVQIGAAIANLMNGEIEVAAKILHEILHQPAERRLATLTTRLHREVSPLLSNPAIEQNKAVILLREEIKEYCSGESGARLLPSGGDS